MEIENRKRITEKSIRNIKGEKWSPVIVPQKIEKAPESISEDYSFMKNKRKTSEKSSAVPDTQTIAEYFGKKGR